MENLKSARVGKEGSDSSDKEKARLQKCTKNTVRPWRKKIIENFCEMKYRSKQKKGTKKGDAVDGPKPTDKTEKQDKKQQVDKVQKKLKSKVQREGPHKDLKRLKHGPKQNIFKEKRNVNKKVPKQHTTLQKVHIQYISQVHHHT